jgi:PilZ domain
MDAANGSSPLAPSERRTGIRHVCPQPTTIPVVIRPTCTHGQAQVRDVSPRAMGLLYKEALPPGTRLALLPPTLHPGPRRTVLGVVTHATPYPAGGWVIGCALAEPLDEDQLRACLL